MLNGPAAIHLFVTTLPAQPNGASPEDEYLPHLLVGSEPSFKLLEPIKFAISISMSHSS